MKTKDLEYWKNNCEEDYLHTPISVLRYISELEKAIDYAHSCQLLLCDDRDVWENHLTNGKIYKMIYEDNDTYHLIDDSGKAHDYFKGRFTKVNAQ